MAYQTDICSTPYIVWKNYIIEKQFGTENAEWPGISLLVYKRGDSTPKDRITFNTVSKMILENNTKLPKEIEDEICRLILGGVIKISDFMVDY